MAAVPTLVSSTAENALMEMLFKLQQIQLDDTQNINNANIVRNLSINTNNDLTATIVLPMSVATFDVNGNLVRGATESLVSA